MTIRQNEKPLRRSGKNSRSAHRRILIYCEGRNTETIYLHGVRRSLRTPITIVVGPQHTEPLSLVRAAAKHAKSCSSDIDERFDEVWCVIDVEAPTEHPGLDRALRAAKQANIQCAISNPCFELWLILHYREQRAYLTTKNAIEMAQQLVPGYNPSAGKSYRFDAVEQKSSDAASRASKMHDAHEAPDERCLNPCTTVDKLLRSIGYC